jgi:hypothetical protein
MKQEISVVGIDIAKRGSYTQGLRIIFPDLSRSVCAG